MPKTIKIHNKSYNLICATVSKPNHFIGIFNINDCYYKVDDLDKSLVLFENIDAKTLKVSKCLYYLLWFNLIISIYWK